MLYKPTSPSPYAEAVVAGDEVTFRCSALGHNVEKARLKLSDNYMQYYFGIEETKTETDYSSEISYTLSTSDEYSAYTITNSEACERVDDKTINLKDIFTGNTEYKWQVRLYEKSSINDPDSYKSNIWLAYGTVGLYSGDDTEDETDDKVYKTDGESYIALKIRPHTNIFFPNNTGLTYVRKKINDKYVYVKYPIGKYHNYYDGNARYYVKLNGKMYPIEDYRFYPPTLKETAIDTVSELSAYFDNYGEPKDGYVVIPYDGNFNAAEGDIYEIYCNYIDSDEFYFNIISQPKLMLTDINETELSESPDSPTTLPYSSLTVNGSYEQADGAIVNHYRAILYMIDTSGVESLIDDTGNVYSSTMVYSYDKLLNGENYKVVFTTSDTNGYITEKTVYIKPSFTELTIPFEISVAYNQEHDSNIIDFSKVKSISAHQSDSAIGYDIDDEGYCAINTGNSFVYDSYDGGKELSFTDHIMYMQIKVQTYKTGLIARSTDDNGDVRELSWDGYNLIAVWDKSGEITTKTVNIVEEGTFETEAGVYAWNDDSEWDDTSVWSENSPLSDNWYIVAVTDTDLYVKPLGIDEYKKGA